MKALTHSFLITLGILAFSSCSLSTKDDVAVEDPISSTPPVLEETKPPFIEIEGIDPNGDSVKFSNIKAKYILVEFWASWCPPCRQFNPGLVSLYNSFQPKGFEILSISLDHKADKWQGAIAKDGLKWPYHISDLGGWDSHWAVKYRVESIPANFLVDPSGKVIASSLSHEQLEATLANLLK
jgi:thiol-disulfide isomerase/thioredoxin